MEDITLTFPPRPVGADETILKPTKSFNQQVYKSVGAILLFVITYLFLFVGTIAIAIVSCMLGYAIMTTGFSFITLAAGVGLALSGLMLVFFVTKFLFKRNKTDYSGMLEITEYEQPQLFAFINRLATETQAPKPKRIFISADVNAGVFYDSSFWSMFFPVKKNLKIGLGLVNTINISEFKAVMAHEFGHFSQKSMKFGSYFYNFNKVIYNMLFDNEGYHQALNSWARIHSILRLMAYINVYIIKGMQSILKQVYLIVNKTYMGLSREMEFQADAIAAGVAGSNQMISSLRRTDLGYSSYMDLLNFLDQKLKENKYSLNIYPQQSTVLKFKANRRHIKLDELKLPLINDNLFMVSSNQVIIDDQWSSHPSNKDRETQLQNINLNVATVNQTAWSLFKNPEQLQLQMTGLLYGNVNTDKAEVMSLEDFETDFSSLINTHAYDERYKDYFDEREVTMFDIEEAISLASTTDAITFEELFTDENCDLPKLTQRMKQDSGLLEVVIEQKDIKTFDYKGVKFFRNDADKIKTEIEAEYQQTIKTIEELDRKIFIFFYNADESPEGRELLISKYKKLFQCQTNTSKDFTLYNDIMLAFSPVYTKMMPDKINNTLSIVYDKEQIMKPRLREILDDISLQPFITADHIKDLKTYLKTNWVYYLNPSYDNTAIDVFRKAMNAYITCVSQSNFELKKDLLDYQLSVL